MSKKQEEKQTITIEEFEKVKAELEALQESSSQMENQLKRAVADYRNLETRIQQGRSELTAWGTIELIKKLLNVLDYLEQSTTGVGEEEKKSGWFRGVEMAVKQFKDVLKSEGLDEIDSIGQFDPSLHEAVDTQEGEDNRILKVTRKGYKMNGRVIRPAQVIVGRRTNDHSERAQRVEESSEESEEGENA